MGGVGGGEEEQETGTRSGRTPMSGGLVLQEVENHLSFKQGNYLILFVFCRTHSS